MTNLPPVLYRGSVKNVRGEVSAETLLFEFSDRYSVFDWGEMPDQLDEKGKTLAIMGKSFFQYLSIGANWEGLFSSKVIQEIFSADYLKALESSELYLRYCTKGLNHHALLNADEMNTPYLKVKNINVIRPPLKEGKYHYEAYTDKPVNALVPLEVIFRLGLPPGNSLSKRNGNDLSKWKAFGFNEVPSSGLLKTPVIDFSTKLERGDRYLDYSEAQQIAGLNAVEWNELHSMTHLIALNLFRFHHDLGLELWDGKIEVGFIPGATPENRSFMLVDSIGIDELRLLYEGKSFSKEFLRETYKESEWFKMLELAKKESLETGVDFKDICTIKYRSAPDFLNKKVKARAEAVYKSYSNAVTQKVSGHKFFAEEFNLKDYSKRYL